MKARDVLGYTPGVKLTPTQAFDVVRVQAALADARRETIRECLAVVQGAGSKGDAEDALAEMLAEVPK